jgi:hypothetical protein
MRQPRPIICWMMLVFTLACLTAGAMPVWLRMVIKNPTATGGLQGTPLVTALVPGTHRNNYTGGVGFGFLCNQNSHVTALGRVLLAGDTGTHYILIVPGTCAGSEYVQVNCGNPTATGSTVVAIDGVNFIFTPLAVPYAISSGSTYQIYSFETSGGDAWLDSNTTLTLAPAEGTIQASVLSSGTNPTGNTGCNTGGGNAYVIPNLYFTVP